MTADKTKGPEEATLNTLYEILHVHELHIKNECLILKGKDKRTNLIDETDQKKKIMSRLHKVKTRRGPSPSEYKQKKSIFRGSKKVYCCMGKILE